MRGGLWTLLFIAILFMSEKATLRRVIPALVIVIAGQLWRCWASGCIGLYRGENVKANSLASKGAYALMRNPLYFGNFLIGLGWSIIAGFRAVIIFVVSFYVLYVLVIIPHEEKFLRQKFGREYEDYCVRVKRFFPVHISMKDLAVSFNKDILMRSEIHTIYSTIAGTFIIIAVSCYTYFS